MQGMVRTKKHLEAILPFATGQQKVYIEYMIANDASCNATADAFGKCKTTVSYAVQAVEKKAADNNIGPDYLHLEHGGPVAPGRTLGKQTVQVNGKGEVIQVWNRLHPDGLALQDLLDGITEAMAQYEPIPSVPPAAMTGPYDEDVVPFYCIGDAHIGMLAHAWEVGESFDIKKAIRELSCGLTALIRNTTPSKKAVIVDFGDATHYENMAGVTEGHGHMLDCDGRFVKMISAYCDIMLSTIETALKIHDTVDVLINQGNHSRTNDLAAAIWLKQIFKDNPRVTILDNVNVFNFYTLDNVQILFHHGDKCKPDKLIDVMINDGRESYGQCEHHYIWTGHVHHRNTSNEFRGISTESFNTLAAKDKHCHDGGWRSRQSISRIDIHRQFGEVGRATYNVEAIRAMLALMGE